MAQRTSASSPSTNRGLPRNIISDPWLWRHWHYERSLALQKLTVYPVTCVCLSRGYADEGCLKIVEAQQLFKVEKHVSGICIILKRSNTLLLSHYIMWPGLKTRTQDPSSVGKLAAVHRNNCSWNRNAYRSFARPRLSCYRALPGPETAERSSNIRSGLR